MAMKLSNDIPNIAVGRLPLYLRALTHLKEQDRNIVSSRELGKRLGIGSAQIRKDLCYFGGFGKQGTGYHIDFLIEQLKEVLQVDKEWQVAVIGAGNLGSAISRYEGFVNRGFRISWVFDNQPDCIGQEFGEITVLSMDELEAVLCQNHVQIVMIAVPVDQAQAVADRAVVCGICAIINYAPISLEVPDDIIVEYIDPIVHLQHMAYYLQNEKEVQ
ncbi:MAG: redox-sensing transcriptional repressor Rex [Chloroflexota bacterium]